MTRSHRLNICAACATQTVKGVDLKRVPPKSLIRPPSDKIALVEEAARRDSDVHVSLSSIHFSNSPGPTKTPSPENRGAVEAKQSSKAGCLPTESSCGASEARHRADVRQRAEGLLYTRRPVGLSTLVVTKNEKTFEPGNALFNELFPQHKRTDPKAVTP